MIQNTNFDGMVTIVPTTHEAIVGIVSGGGRASKIRNGNTSPIKYKDLDLLSKHAEFLGETTWKDFFGNASRGFIPKPFKFDGVSFTIKKKSEQLQYSVILNQQKNIIDVYKECKNFISSTSGISSEVDDNSIFSIQSDAPIEEFRWTGNIPPRQQITYIDIFVNKMSDLHQLSDEVKDDLKKSLVGAIVSTKSIPNTSIITEGYNIKQINGLYFKNGQYFLQELPQKVTKRKIPSVDVTENDVFVFGCSKNLSTLVKKRDYANVLSYCGEG